MQVFVNLASGLIFMMWYFIQILKKKIIIRWYCMRWSAVIEKYVSCGAGLGGDERQGWFVTEGHEQGKVYKMGVRPAVMVELKTGGRDSLGVTRMDKIGNKCIRGTDHVWKQSWDGLDVCRAGRKERRVMDVMKDVWWDGGRWSAVWQGKMIFYIQSVVSLLFR